MDKEKYSFELRRGNNLEDHFTGTVQEALQRGDRLASRLGSTHLYAYNDKRLKWEYIGTFLGHMRYLNKWGGQYIIMSNYTGLVMDSKAQEETPNIETARDTNAGQMIMNLYNKANDNTASKG